MEQLFHTAFFVFGLAVAMRRSCTAGGAIGHGAFRLPSLCAALLHCRRKHWPRSAERIVLLVARHDQREVGFLLAVGRLDIHKQGARRQVHVCL